MKCNLLASGRTSLLLGQVLDRPYLQHMVEQLVGRGVQTIHVFLQRDEEGVRTLLGDGSRWGISVAYTLTGEEPSWGDLTSVPQTAGSELVLAGCAERLPFLPQLSGDAAEGTDWPSLYFEDADTRSRWTGWALLRASDLALFAQGLAAGKGWLDSLRQNGVQARKVFLDRQSLSCANERDLLLSNRAALDGSFPGLFFRGKEVRPGIWMARAARIPASATLHAPCYVGEESWIGRDCNLGPHAVVGPRCVVARGTAIARSVLADSTYLGPELDVADSLVTQARVHNVRLGVELEIEESHVACGLAGQPARPWWRF